MSSTPSQREQEQHLNEFFKLLRVLPFVMLGVLLNAYFLFLFWHWFIVPLGLREISFWHSAGLSAGISYLRSSWKNPQKDETRGYDYWTKHVQAGYKELAFYFVSVSVCHLLMTH